MVHRAVRVFVSSTFRDMHGERDHLVTVVFPELRERLARLDLEFFDVDLRWGVPQHDANGETANSWAYCKQWIDQVQPFFICLLGERYGWVPPPAAIVDSADRQKWSGLSITEMEIRHGVFEDSNTARHSYFYLRALKVPPGIAGEIYREFVDPKDQGRLERLKEEIRSFGRPVRDYACHWQHDHFTGLDEFGRMVLDDLWSGVLRDPRYVPPDLWRQAAGESPEHDPRYLDQTNPVPPVVWEKLLALRKPTTTNDWELERRQMREFAQDRLHWFHGREQELAQLQEFVERPLGEHHGPVCVVAAPPGQGKSSLLARLSERLSEAGHWVIDYFVGATEGSTDVQTLLRHWNSELLRGGLMLPEEAAGKELSVHELRALRQMLVARLAICASERRVVLLLDGVNQLADSHDMQWLPEQLGSAARVILSCAEDPGDLAAARTLEALRYRWPRPEWINLRPLDSADVRKVVQSFLRAYCKELDREHLDTICRLEQVRNPLYLLVLLHELRTLGGNDLNRFVPQLIAQLSERFPTTVALFNWVLERLETFGAEAVRWWCIYLHLGRTGMSSGELRDLLERKLGGDAALAALRIERSLRRYLQRRGGRLDFFHSQLREAVARRYLPSETAACHKDLADYFETRWRLSDEHALRELPHHLLQAALWDRAVERLTDLHFLETKVVAGQHFQLVGDFTAATRVLPAERNEAVLIRLLGQSLEMDLSFLAAHPTALFQCLWNRCWWYDAPRPGEPQRDPPAQGPPAPKLHVLMEKWREQKERATCGFRWVRSLRAPNEPLSLARSSTLWGICALAFSPDSRYLLFDEGRTLGIWDLGRKEIVARLTGHDYPVKTACFTSDGSHVLAPVGENPVHWCVWNATSGQLLTRLEMPNRPRNPVISPEVNRFLFVSQSGVHLHDAASGGHIATVPLGPHNFFAEAFLLPNAERILVHERRAHWSKFPPPFGDLWDDTIRLWDVTRGEERLRLSSVTHGFQCVAWADDGHWLVTGAKDGIVRAWRTDDGDEVVRIGRHRRRVTAVAVGPGARHVASASRDGTLRLWDRQSPGELRRWRIGRRAISALAFSSDGQRLAAEFFNHTLCVWSLEDGRELLQVRDADGHNFLYEDDPNFKQLRFSDDGLRLIAEGAVRGVWNVAKARKLGHKEYVSPDGRWRVSQTVHRGCLEIDDPEDGLFDFCVNDAIDTTPDSLSIVDRIAWSPTGDCLAVSTKSGVVLWDPHRDRIRHRFPSGDGSAGLVFSNDGLWLIAAGTMTINILQTDTGRLRSRIFGHNNRINCVAYSSVAQCIASCSSDGTVRIWNLHSAESRSLWGRFCGTVNAATQTASLFAWGLVQVIWMGALVLLHLPADPLNLPVMTSRTQRWRLLGHDGQVWAVAFAPDGQRVASGGKDSTIRVWDAVAGRQLTCLRGHSQGIQDLSFSSDGRHIISRGGDETIRVWDADSGDCLQTTPGYRTQFLEIAEQHSLHWHGDVLIDARTGSELACFPVRSTESLVTDPTGRVWANTTSDQRLQCFRLEGADPFDIPGPRA